MAQALGLTLPLQIGNMGYFQQGFDTLTQIKSNFINLILTRKGERVHQPEFGCDIHAYLFEQMTPENIELARQSVLDAIEKWMPFLQLLTFELNASDTDIDNNRLQLYVGYSLRINPNIQDLIVLTF
jgi:phage baseplate assembly protein W